MIKSFQKDNIEVSSKLSFEYKPKFSSFYLENNSPEEFSLDLRELYLTWYFDNADFSVGKQIHTWGSVDQNSPLDNASPYDYYYIFLTLHNFLLFLNSVYLTFPYVYHSFF